jgi:hypothetical protein
MGSRYNLVGQKFNKLTVLKRAGSNSHQKALWECKCDCGKLVDVVTSSLRRGDTKSCGCIIKELAVEKGKLKRVIDYVNLTCSSCGRKINNKYLSKNGTIKIYLIEKRTSSLKCKDCLKKLARTNGIVASFDKWSIKPNKDQIQVIIGSILGDGHLSKAVSKNFGLEIKHSMKQEKYLLWKNKILGELVSKIDYPEIIGFRDKFKRKRVRLRCIRHPIFTKMAKVFLTNGKKFIKMNPFLKKIDRLGFAIWYLDDGSLDHPTFRYKKPTIRFATGLMNEEERKVLRSLLERKVGVRTSTCIWGTPEKRYYGIRLYGGYVEKFLKYIGKVVDWEISGMSYKNLMGKTEIAAGQP